MYFGVDYYPEHWGEDRREIDLNLMKELNFNMIRIAEFAWSRLEPEEGKYDFAWLDRVINLGEKYGMKVMLGVPVRNVPAWLIKKDPTIAILNSDGQYESFGSRYTTCINNPTLREHAFQLANVMVNKYKNNPNVVSWHLDNEYGDASMCFCGNCKSKFTEFLKNKYKTVEELNKAWGLVFWSLEVNDWDQVWVPAKINHFPHNPGLLQDYHRFTSWSTEMFVKDHAAIFKNNAPHQTITTNLQSMTRDHTDYFELGKYIDVVSTNYYPPVSYNGADLDIMRGLKKQNFWIVEQKSGPPGFAHNGYLTPHPGETRMYTYQSIAHGADAILYFRFRPSYFGQEQLHKGILDYDGRKNRIFNEIKQVGTEIEKVWEEVKDTTNKNDVGLLMSYDSRWALKHFYPHPELNYREHFLQYYNILKEKHVGVDIIHPKDNLSNYKLVIVPLLYVMDEEMIDNIVNYVKQGGTLIFTARSGAKDQNSNMTPTTLPPKIAEMLGVNIEESFALAPGVKNFINSKDQKQFSVSKWVDLINPTSAEVIGRYESDWYKNYPAITYNTYGVGKAYYIGTIPEKEFCKEIISEILNHSGDLHSFIADEDVEIITRQSKNKKVVFLLNHSSKKKIVNVKEKFINLFERNEVYGEIQLEAFGVYVLINNDNR